MPTVTYTIDELILHKESGAFAAAIEALRKKAEQIIANPPRRVVDIRLPRPSGNPHDYVSIGPYWWPNPDTPDGLPWVRRDGYVNPDARSGADPSSFYSAVHRLALAEFYIGGGGYAECANKILYSRFIDPATKMNPNALYAQGIPGICEGRGIGLIEYCLSYKLFNALGILEHLGLLDEGVHEGVRAWFWELCDWMLTHEYGLEEDNTTNNHGSWYDANIIATAAYLGRPSLVRKIAMSAYQRRVKALIRPDGSQPSELIRTRAMHYSLYNLSALRVIAAVAEKNGSGAYWSDDGECGVCLIKKAVDFLYPYIKNPESFPFEEMNPGQQTDAAVCALLSVSKRFQGEGYAERAGELMSDSGEYHLEPAL